MRDHWSGITAIYGDPASLERDNWRSVTLRANRHHLTAMRDHWSGITAAGSLLFMVIPPPCSGITTIYGDPASLERDHWRSVTLRANKQHLTAAKDAASP